MRKPLARGAINAAASHFLIEAFGYQDDDLVHSLSDYCAFQLGLTVRESEVVLLLAAGHTNAEIAEELDLSPRTVARHLSQIFDKVGIRTRAGVVGNVLTGALGHETRNSGRSVARSQEAP